MTEVETCDWHRELHISERAKMVRAQICWTCHAQPGERCVSNRGRPTPDHVNRWKAAQAQFCSCEPE
jgi:hypothetical protein